MTQEEQDLHYFMKSQIPILAHHIEQALRVKFPAIKGLEVVVEESENPKGVGIHVKFERVGPKATQDVVDFLTSLFTATKVKIRVQFGPDINLN